MKRIFSLILALGAALAAFGLTVGANSAQTYWSGVSSSGVVVLDGACPLEVKNETLTLDISEFPSNYYSDADEYLAYTGSVTAEYAFYNPTELTVTARLVFPFGKQPDYAVLYDENDYTRVAYADTEKYGIEVNGEAIEKHIRHTLSYDTQLELSHDLPRLNDGYISDSFYYPEMTVTRYTYAVGGIDKEKYGAANVAFDWYGGNGATRLCFPEQSGMHRQKNGDVRLSTWADNGDVFSVYVIGQPPAEAFDMRCYKNGGVKKEIDGTVTLIATEVTTLEELALENRSESSGVSESDWYNAVIDCFNYNEADGVVPLYSAKTLISSLMRWYEYEITLAPRESVVNTVTAPIYPEIDMSFTPSTYTYTYFLSPASMWASFGDLEINVNTPFYMTENSLDGFVRTDSGYTLRLDGLPDGELVLTLCTSDTPVKRESKPSHSSKLRSLGFYAVIATVVLLAVAAAAVAVTAVKKKGSAK